MNKHFININKTAKYFTLGKFNENTKEVWFLLHGYAQTGEEFLNSFNRLLSDSNFLIAPEALNKFYFRGFSGKIGASWMTSEDREIEINDYLYYLNLLYDTFDFPEGVKINLLGFSQGTATATRWFVSSRIKFEKIILWGGGIAKELIDKSNVEKFNSVSIKILHGDRDAFLIPQKLETLKNVLTEAEIKYEIIEYKGKHEISPELFEKL